MTGTAAGDPIEAEALARTFGKSRDVDDPIFVGSVKTNVGHAEPVSGLAAIIKACYALREGLIPRNLNYKVPHKNIPLVGIHDNSHGVLEILLPPLRFTNTEILIARLAFASTNRFNALAR